MNRQQLCDLDRYLTTEPEIDGAPQSNFDPDPDVDYGDDDDAYMQTAKEDPRGVPVPEEIDGYALEMDLRNALECLQTAVDAAYGPHSIRATNTTIRAHIDRGTTDTVRVELGKQVSIVGDTDGNIAVVLHAVTDMDSYDAQCASEHLKRASDIVHTLEMAW